MPVASPAFLDARAALVDIADLSSQPTISYRKRTAQNEWVLFDGDDKAFTVRHEPRIIANDFAVLREAALEGLGVALLPQAICFDALADGRLCRLLPDYHGGETQMHLLFTSRRGMLPAVRVLVDHLIETLPELLRRKRRDQDERFTASFRKVAPVFVRHDAAN